MNKILTTIAAALLFLLPAPAFAGYVIHLKDGTQFVTDQYFEEGDLIKFKRYGGLVGIENDRIRNIEEISDLPEKENERSPQPVTPSTPAVDTPKEQKPEDASEKIMSSGGKVSEAKSGTESVGKKKPAEVSEEEKKKAEQEKAAELQALLDEKRQIMREMGQTTSAFKEAKAARNERQKKQYWNELLSLQKKLGELRDRAAAQNGGQLPEWWDRW